MNQQLLVKREQFTETIRKKNKKQSLDQQRKRSLQMLKIIATMPQRTPQQLSQQREKLQSLAVAFRGEPDQNWTEYIEDLRKIMETCEDYSYVVEICIIKQICLVYKKEFKNLNLTQKASLLLNYMIFHNKTGTYSLVRMLSEYGLIDDLLILIVEQQRLQSRLEQLHLIGNMIGENGYIRNLFFQKGWIQILIALQKNKNLGQEMRNIIVWLINSMVIYYQNTSFNLKNNVSSVFIQILVDYVLDQKSGQQRKMDAINGLINIIKNKGTAAHTIAKQKGLYHHLIQIAQSKQESLKPPVWKLLNQFIQPKLPQVSREMLKTGILDIITNIFKNTPDTSYRVTIQNIIFKLSQNSQQNLNQIVTHPIFDQIIQRSSLYFSSSSPQITYNNLILISFLTNPLPYFTLRNILEQTSILQIINQHIINSQTSADILHACLVIIQHLIQTFNNVYSPNGVNQLVQKLQRQYSMSTKIYDISNNHQNQKVTQIAEKVYDEFVKTYN